LLTPLPTADKPLLKLAVFYFICTGTVTARSLVDPELFVPDPGSSGFGSDRLNIINFETALKNLIIILK
jgi:hypothetical protein